MRIKIINKLANLTTIVIILFFSGFILYKNANIKSTKEKKDHDKKIEKCISNNPTPLKSLECIGKDVIDLPIEKYKSKFNQL